jgi:hypothetical protein
MIWIHAIHRYSYFNISCYYATAAVRRLHDGNEKFIQKLVGKFLAEAGDTEGNRQRRAKQDHNTEELEDDVWFNDATSV